MRRNWISKENSEANFRRLRLSARDAFIAYLNVCTKGSAFPFDCG